MGWQKKIYEYFYPNRKRNEEVFGAWETFLTDYENNLVTGIHSLEISTADAAAAKVENELTKKTNYVIENILYGKDFASLPEKIKSNVYSLTKEIIAGIDEADWYQGEQHLTDLIITETKKRVDDYGNMMSQARDLFKSTGIYKEEDINAAWSEHGNQLQDLQHTIDAYNQLHGTTYTLSSVMQAAVDPAKDLGEAIEDDGEKARVTMMRLEALWKSINEGAKGWRISQKSDNNWMSELEQMKKHLEGMRLDKIISGMEYMDEDYRDAMRGDFKWLDQFLELVSKGDRDGALSFLNEQMANLDESAVSLKESLKGVREELEVKTATKQNFISQASDLAQYLPSKQAVEDYMLTAFAGGNVDLTTRPVLKIDGIDLDRDSILKSWDVAEGDIATVLTKTISTSDYDDLRFEKDVVVNLTPILPTGEVLTPFELEDYFFSLVDQSQNARDFIEADKVENGGLGILLYAEDVNGEIDDALAKAETWAVKLHEIHELYYGGLFKEGTIDTSGITNYISSLSEGMREALFEFSPELEKALALMDSDDLYEQEEGARLFEEAILAMASAWDRYAESYLAAQELEIDDEKGLALMQNLSRAYDTDGIDGYRDAFARMTKEEQEWIETNSKAHKQIVKAWKKGEDGIEDNEKAMKKFNREMKKLELDNLADAGKIWKEVADIADESVDTEQELYDAYNDVKSKLSDITDAQSDLNLVMNSSNKSSDEYKEALENLKSLCGITSDSEEDLAYAQQFLANQMDIATMSSGELLNYLMTMTGITFNSATWQSELAALAASGDAAAICMQNLVSYINSIDGTRINYANGLFSVSGLGSAALKRSGGTRRSSGGGGSGSSGNEMSEIEKMLDLMEQIQDIRKHQMDMIATTRDYYESQGY